MSEDDLDFLDDIDEDKDYAKDAIDNEATYQPDNDCGDSCKL